MLLVETGTAAVAAQSDEQMPSTATASQARQQSQQLAEAGSRSQAWDASDVCMAAPACDSGVAGGTRKTRSVSIVAASQLIFIARLSVNSP